jgi:DNA-binding protein H-NS
VTPADLEKLSIKDLRDLRDRVDKALVTAIPREKAQLTAKIKAMAAEQGLNLADVMNDEPSK